jgi:hypothetical protein
VLLETSALATIPDYDGAGAGAGAARVGLSGSLAVTVVSAEGLPAQQHSGNLHCDPYCSVRLLPSGASKVSGGWQEIKQAHGYTDRQTQTADTDGRQGIK